MQSDWRGTYRVDDVDTNNFEAAGFDQGTTGMKVFEFSSGGIWNALGNVFDAPALFPTDLFPSLQFFISQGDGTNWLLPFARILSAENSAPNMRDAIKFAFSGKSNGSFTIPTGNF